jgi:hypothetical protein
MVIQTDHWMKIPGQDNPANTNRQSRSGFRIVRHGGNYLLFKQGRHMFTLTKQVRVPPRMGLQAFMEERYEGLVDDIWFRLYKDKTFENVVSDAWRMG